MSDELEPLPLAPFELRGKTAEEPVIVRWVARNIDDPSPNPGECPDPFAWMRLFRALTARVEVDESGAVTAFTTRTDAPNLYTVIAIDGQALGKALTPVLRDRPLVTDRG